MARGGSEPSPATTAMSAATAAPISVTRSHSARQARGGSPEAGGRPDGDQGGGASPSRRQQALAAAAASQASHSRSNAVASAEVRTAATRPSSSLQAADGPVPAPSRRRSPSQSAPSREAITSTDSAAAARSRQAAPPQTQPGGGATSWSPRSPDRGSRPTPGPESAVSMTTRSRRFIRPQPSS